MAQYEVSWSNIYTADSPEDAIRQAIGDVTDPYSVATIWIARDGEDRWVLDMDPADGMASVVDAPIGYDPLPPSLD